MSTKKPVLVFFVFCPYTLKYVNAGSIDRPVVINTARDLPLVLLIPFVNYSIKEKYSTP